MAAELRVRMDSRPHLARPLNQSPGWATGMVPAPVLQGPGWRAQLSASERGDGEPVPGTRGLAWVGVVGSSGLRHTPGSTEEAAGDLCP